MQPEQTFKERLSGGPPAICCWLVLFSPLAEEIVAQAGFDCVLIDLEHGQVQNLTTGHAYQAEPYPPFMMDIIRAGGLVPYTRRRMET